MALVHETTRYISRRFQHLSYDGGDRLFGQQHKSVANTTERTAAEHISALGCDIETLPIHSSTNCGGHHVEVDWPSFGLLQCLKE